MRIPYGVGFLDYGGNYDSVLQSRVDEMHGTDSAEEIVAEAMANPIGSDTLRMIAIGKQRCTIIISDHTRPVPSKVILPKMIEELKTANPQMDITFLVATGLHRATSTEELRAKLGDEIVDNYKIEIHDAFDPAKNVELGVLPSGAKMIVDRLAVETDLLIAEGFIEPHFFAGYSGGRKSVLPGVAGKETVLGNHCGKFIAAPQARTGVLDDNPIHMDMVAGARMARLAYIVNVVLDGEKNVVAAFAGNFEKAHEAGVNFIRKYCEVPASPADIVITSNNGAPLDQNIYQCVKGLTAAEATTKDGGVIIMCAELKDGTGSDEFYKTMCDCRDFSALFEKFSNTPMTETIPAQWESQIMARIMANYKIIFVSRPEMKDALLKMHVGYAENLDDAIAQARALRGENASITVVPNGVSVVVKRS